MDLYRTLNVMDPVELGRLMRARRVELELEVSEAARAAHVSTAQWHKWERGEGGIPQIASRRKIRNVLGWDRWPDGEDGPPPVAAPEPAPDQMMELQQAMAQLVREQAAIAKELRAVRRLLERREAG